MLGEMKTAESEAERLERLWAGRFGDAHAKRNQPTYVNRGPFWETLISNHKINSVLEVGCNTGPNLHWLSQMLPDGAVFGVDVNEAALERAKLIENVDVRVASARDLPFPDGTFDLVFTAGVLIHLPADIVPVAMGEMVRCSSRYVMCAEYYADELTEVPYRGHRDALYKRDFGGLYAERFPELGLVEQGFLNELPGWDAVTWWLFEK